MPCGYSVIGSGGSSGRIVSIVIIYGHLRASIRQRVMAEAPSKELGLCGSDGATAELVLRRAVEHGGIRRRRILLRWSVRWRRLRRSARRRPRGGLTGPDRRQFVLLPASWSGRGDTASRAPRPPPVAQIGLGQTGFEQPPSDGGRPRRLPISKERLERRLRPDIAILRGAVRQVAETRRKARHDECTIAGQGGIRVYPGNTPRSTTPSSPEQRDPDEDRYR